MNTIKTLALATIIIGMASCATLYRMYGNVTSQTGPRCITCVAYRNP